MTEGEYRVGISFNPGKMPDVDYIKEAAADLIDYVMANGNDDRCTAIACTEIESAAMWAVKSVTKPDRNVDAVRGKRYPLEPELAHV